SAILRKKVEIFASAWNTWDHIGGGFGSIEWGAVNGSRGFPMTGSGCSGRIQRKIFSGIASTMLGCLSATSANGAIAITNEVIPGIATGDPWNVGGPLVVGELLTGEMTVDSGSGVTDTDGYVANSAGSTGVVTVKGTGTTWSNSGELRMG